VNGLSRRSLRSVAAPTSCAATGAGSRKVIDTIAGQKELAFAAQFENSGVAPAYQDHVLVWKLADGSEPMIVHAPVKPHRRLPGRHDLEERLVLPGPLSAGTWELSGAIQDPSTGQPAITLANSGTVREGWHEVGKLAVRT
jgi:hypothetical protein